MQAWTKKNPVQEPKIPILDQSKEPGYEGPKYASQVKFDTNLKKIGGSNITHY